MTDEYHASDAAHRQIYQKKTTYKEQTLTYGTLFLSSWTDRLVFVTEKKKRKYTQVSVLKQSATNPWSTHTIISLFGKSKYCCRRFMRSSLNTNHPEGHGFYPCKFQNMKPVREEDKKKFFVVVSKHKPRQSYINNTRQHKYLDVEFKVFIHGKDVVENVLGNARNDAHLVRVVQLALKQESTDKGEMVIDIQGQREEVI